MASYTKTTPSSLADELVCVVSVGNQSENNITGSTSGKLYLVEVDNTENSDIPVFLNIADASSATAGTTVPDFTSARRHNTHPQATTRVSVFVHAPQFTHHIVCF